MIETIPSKEQIESLLGATAIEAWNELIEFVELHYEFDLYGMKVESMAFGK